MNGDNHENHDEDNDIINCDDPIENGINGPENYDEDDDEEEDFFNERANKKQQNPQNSHIEEEEQQEEGGGMDHDDDFSNNSDANHVEVIDGEDDDDLHDDDDDDEEEEEEDEEEEELEEGENVFKSSEYESAHLSQNSRSQCKFCSFIAKSPAKLQLHLATHYNLKPFMCPVCTRRANFKWDIQKHLRKIHNDHTSDVICLSEGEARKSINSYIEHKQFVHNNNANAIIYENSVEKILKNPDQEGAGDSDLDGEEENENEHEGEDEDDDLELEEEGLGNATLTFN